jgi:hypothetical protein
MNYDLTLTLANTDENYISFDSPLLEGLSVYQMDHTNDLLILGTGTLESTLGAISHTGGIISSRTCLLSSIPLPRSMLEVGLSSSPTQEVLLLKSRVGKTEELIEILKKEEDTIALYRSTGLYDLVVFTDNPVLLQKIRDSSLLKRFSSARLTPGIETFPLGNLSLPISSKDYDSRNRYETDYLPSSENYRSYAEGCIEMAKRLIEIEKRNGKFTLIYAPLRGALPIVDGMLEAYLLLGQEPVSTINFPVTSSFVFYPPSHPYTTKKGKRPASGRTTNILELKRMKKRGLDLQRVLYIDEIVSGGMMIGHLNEMIKESKEPQKEGILRQEVLAGDISLTVMGLMHDHGKKFGSSKSKALLKYSTSGLVEFHPVGIDNLVTEDQRFLLGQHYLHYNYGPHQIPFISDYGDYYPENEDFWNCLKTNISNKLKKG